MSRGSKLAVTQLKIDTEQTDICLNEPIHKQFEFIPFAKLRMHIS